MPDYDLDEEIASARRMAAYKFPNQQVPDALTDLQALVYGQADPSVVADALTVGKYKNTIDAKGPGGMTALMYAAKDLKGDIAKELVTAGANKALTNDAGETAVQIFDEASNADQEAIDAESLPAVRAIFEGGRRRRKTRARLSRKTKRRTTRRRR